MTNFLGDELCGKKKVKEERKLEMESKIEVILNGME